MQLPTLTFLRFLAAFGVVLFHVGPFMPSLAWGSALWARANTGVSFFFVLSGFILALVYGGRDFSRAEFYVARAARILPLYWLALAIAAALAAVRGSLEPLPLLSSALLLQAWWPGSVLTLNVPGWSLSVEALFYVVFPTLLRRLGRLETRGLLAVLLGSWAGNLALHVALVGLAERAASERIDDLVYYHPLLHLPTFVSGIASGLLFARHRARLAPFALMLASGSLLVLFALLLIPNAIVRYHHNGLFTPLFVLLIWGVGAEQGRLSRVLAARPLVLLGEVSYGIYLLQYPLHKVYEVAVGGFFTPNLHYTVWFAMVMAVSLTAYRFLEVPLRSRVRALYARWRERGPKPTRRAA